MNEDFPVMYILARNDIQSMNCGKLAAQTSHASSALEHKFKDVSYNNELFYTYNTWKSETNQGFGTVLVLSCDKYQLVDIIHKVSNKNNIMSDIVVDPTYPYIVNKEISSLIPFDYDTKERVYKEDGSVVMFRSETTCAYIFGMKNDIEKHVSHLELY